MGRRFGVWDRDILNAVAMPKDSYGNTHILKNAATESEDNPSPEEFIVIPFHLY